MRGDGSERDVGVREFPDQWINPIAINHSRRNETNTYMILN